MSEQPAPTTPEPEFSKALSKTGPKTHCPVCHLPEIRYAHEHCPKTNKHCTWKVCKCGITWDTVTGRYNEPISGAP